MTISAHVETFAGKPAKDYDSGKKITIANVYRLALDYGADKSFPELLDEFLTTYGKSGPDALIVGSWGESQQGGAEMIHALVGAKDRMPNLKALFIGDITFEECEMSWINYGDVSELLPAYPELAEFRIRGTNSLDFGDVSHANLKSLAVESGGMASELIEQILGFDLPNLAHLELWLGDSGYGGIEDVEVLQPLLDGKPFPKLKSLGLRNSRIADDVAKAVAKSKLLDRLQMLDLSLGNMGDDGAKALLAQPKIKSLLSLDLHHHYFSDKTIAKLEALGIPVDLSEAEDSDTDPEDRYITVGE